MTRVNPNMNINKSRLNTISVTDLKRVLLSSSESRFSKDEIYFSGRSSEGAKSNSKISSPHDVTQAVLKNLDNPAQTLVWMSDFDGVLRAFSANPTQSHLSKEDQQFLLKFIDAFNAKTGLPFVIVTGRPVEDIVAFFGKDNQGKSVLKNKPVWINGLHGGLLFDCQTQVSLQDATPQQQKMIQTLYEHLSISTGSKESFIKRYPSVQIEQKGATLAIHDKALPSEQAVKAQLEFKNMVNTLKMTDETVMGKGNTFVVKEGEGVLEVLPLQFTKGEGIKNVLNRLAQLSEMPLTPFFVGDGLTDNDGFNYLNGAYPDAVTVFVGKPNKEVNARFTIANAQHTGDIRTDTPEGEALRTLVSKRNVDAVYQIMRGIFDRFKA